MTTNNSFVRISPQVAFPNGPFDVNPTFTDLTAYVRDDSPFKISRGRSNEFSQFEAGRVSGLTLDNRTRVFDPNYTSAPAPFAGNIIPSKQLQMLAEYPWLPGMLPEGNLRNTGWNAFGSGGPTTYDQAGYTYDQAGSVYDASGNTTLALAAGDAPAGVAPAQALKITVNSGTLGGAVYGTSLSVIAGKAVTFTARVMMTSANAGATSQPQTVVINWLQANGNPSAVKGASQATVTTPKRTFGNGVWDVVVLTATVPSDAASMQLQLNSTVYQAGDAIYWDTLVVDYASQWIQKPIAYTYVDDWKLTYNLRDSVCTVSASDAFAMLGVKDLMSFDYDNQIAATANLRHYWTLGERTDWTSPYTQEYAPGTARLITKYFAGWGVPGPVLTDLTTGVGLTDDQTYTIAGWFDAGAMLTPAATGGWSIGFWCQQAGTTDRIINIGLSTDPNASIYHNFNDDFINVYTNAAVTAGVVESPAASLQFVAQHYHTSTAAYAISCWFKPPPDVVDPRIPAYTSPGSFYDGAWHFVVITMASDQQTFSFYVDGQQVTPSIAGGSGTGSGNASGQNVVADGPISVPTTIRGLVGGSNDVPGYTGQLAKLFVVDRAMTGSEISTLYNMAQAKWFGQTPQARLNAVLDTVGFPSNKRNLDVGSSVLNSEVSNLAQTNSLQYAQYVEASEAGWFFADMAGNARLIGRLNFVKKNATGAGTTPQWTLGDLWPQNPAQELPIVDSPDIDNSNTLIYTEAEGSMGTGARASGTARKTSGNLYVYADNATLIVQGKRSLSKTNMLNTTEQEVYNLLSYWIALYKGARQRVQKVKIRPESCDELWQFVLSVEIGNVCKFNLRPPPAGSNITTLIGRVQQVEHTISRRRWETEIAFATVDVNTYLNLDDATLGKLDSGNQLFF